MTSIQPQGHNFHSTSANVAGMALTLVCILFTLATSSVHAQIPAPAILYSFQGVPNDIYNPTGILAQGRDGNIYGTGNLEAADHQGGIYKITPEGVETLIVSFPANWQGCQGLSLGFDGNFYGTCGFDGAHGDGFVFQATPAGVLTDIYDFTDDNNDANPVTVPVLGANGDFYGTSGRGNYACGNIYRVTTAGVYKNIKSGNAYCSPTQISAGSNGDFYGAWGNVPSGNTGAVFQVTASGSYKEIHDFNSTTDPSWYPVTGPILATDGKLYGTDIGGGTNSNGAIYSMKTNGMELTDLFNINSSADGALEGNNLIQASDGNFYGASYNGGSGNQGSFYELTSDNVFSVDLLVSNTTNGDSPATALMQHTNGTIYGTTSTNGPSPGLGQFESFDIGAAPFIALVGPVPAATEGTQVQILGQNFTSSSEVKFGGTAATTVTVTGSTFIEATVPTGALTGPITVTTSSGTLSTLVTFDVTPTAASFTPPSGDVGTVVSISGTGLTQTTEVKFHGTKATSFSVVSDSEVTATVPSDATTGTISVTTKGGTATTTSKFTVN